MADVMPYHFMRWRQDARKFIASTKVEGLRGTLQVVGRTLMHRMHRVVDRRYDHALGIETAANVHLDDLTINSTNTSFGDDEVIYVGTPISQFRFMMAQLPLPLDDFVFVDFGSGKGRCLLAAAEYPFQKVVGVEFAVELHAIAMDNIGRSRNRKQCHDLTSAHADATEYPIPSEPCVFYFANPFESVIMSQVLENIRVSHDANPRKMYFIYCNSRYPEPFEELAFLRRVRPKHWARLGALPPLYKFRIYETA